MKMGLSNRKFNIGDTVYLNIAEGEIGKVIALVVYDTYIDYLVMHQAGNVAQYCEVQITDEKQF